MAFSRFLSAAHSGQPIRVFGDGEQIRDFTYVDDIVEANVMAATSEIRPGSVYNVAGGSSVTVNEVLSLMESQIGSRLHIERGSPVSGDVRRTGGATEAFSEVTGWKSAVGLAQGIAQQSDWIRGNGDARGLVGMG
jgi:nucleoside-diphosphate-sugar epimerase